MENKQTSYSKNSTKDYISALFCAVAIILILFGIAKIYEKEVTEKENAPSNEFVGSYTFYENEDIYDSDINISIADQVKDGKYFFAIYKQMDEDNVITGFAKIEDDKIILPKSGEDAVITKSSQNTYTIRYNGEEHTAEKTSTAFIILNNETVAKAYDKYCG